MLKQKSVPDQIFSDRLETIQISVLAIYFPTIIGSKIRYRDKAKRIEIQKELTVNFSFNLSKISNLIVLYFISNDKHFRLVVVVVVVGVLRLK